MSEHHDQCALFQWMRLELPTVECMAFAVPNGGHRHIAVASKLKAEGVKSGVPDIFIARPTVDGKPGLFIEMKATKGYASTPQKAWLERLEDNGYATALCRGFDAAQACVRANYGEIKKARAL